jgi:hydroxymethylbilane synthase
MNTPPLRLGTRASPLARWQAEWVAAQLARHGVAVTLVPITTTGDRDQRGPVAQIGGQGLFTKEIQRAVLQHEADLAVHSLKDLPTEAVPGLVLAAVPPRAACGDVLVCRAASGLDTLPQGAVVGTGSIRRRAQLWHVRPDLQMRDIRGNVDTRLRKLSDGEFDALVLAEAGLTRLQLADRITQRLPRDVMLPAVGQGALGLECRADDAATQAALKLLDDPPSHACVLAERALLAALRAGCLAPVGAWARADAGAIDLYCVVL